MKVFKEVLSGLWLVAQLVFWELVLWAWKRLVKPMIPKMTMSVIGRTQLTFGFYTGIWGLVWGTFLDGGWSMVALFLSCFLLALTTGFIVDSLHGIQLLYILRGNDKKRIEKLEGQVEAMKERMELINPTIH